MDMNLQSFGKIALKGLVYGLVLAPALAGAQYFTDTQAGDVDAGFRKTGPYQEQYEMVVYLGNVSNFLAMAPGAQISITNFSSPLSTMCPDGLGNLQWSVFAQFQGSLNNSSGSWPRSSCWYTVPRSNIGVQTTPINRLPSSIMNSLRSQMSGVSTGANKLSTQIDAGNTNANNNSLLILEPVNYSPVDNLTEFIGDPANPDFGDFGGYLNFSVENTTPASFSSPVVSDFYVNVPVGSLFGQPLIDPLTGSAQGTADYLGYFTLNPNGTMTFTRSGGTATPPSAGTVSGSATNGFDGLQVVFTNTASGSITNWVWDFGNGTVITNTTGGNVTNTYAATGSYTVTLTVRGPGGSDTRIMGNYIVTSPTPKFSGTVLLSGNNLIFGGSNCPAGMQYRILTTTNVELSVSNWVPVATNYFRPDGTYSYTNNATTNQGAYFRLASP